MSDLPLPDDELLSSHLDGELSAADAARLEERLAVEPALKARLDAMRAAASLSSSPVDPLSPTAADSMIAAALAASSTSPNVTDLAAAGSRRRVWPARVATVAAGVVALAIAVPALRAIDGDDQTDATSADAADGDESAFDAGGDSGDDTAADMSFEAATVEPDADAESGPMFDAPADDMAESDTEDGDDSTDTAADGGVVSGEGEAYTAAQLQLFASDPAFDPLDDDLGAYDSTETLSIDLSARWTAYGNPTDPPATTTTASLPPETPTAEFTAEEVAAAASARLAAVETELCDGFADVVLERLADESVVSADYATATVDGLGVVIGLYRLVDDQAIALVVDLDTCEPRDVRLN